MKKIFLLLCYTIITIHFIIGQGINESASTSPKEMHDMFMKRSKTNKIAGWTMIGAGIGMTIGGFALNATYGWGEGNKNNGLWLSYLGGASTLASVPFFISAGSNKRKASLALKGATVAIRNKTSDKYCIPAIALMVKF